MSTWLLTQLRLRATTVNSSPIQVRLSLQRHLIVCNYACDAALSFLYGRIDAAIIRLHEIVLTRALLIFIHFLYNADSSIELSESTRTALAAELAKKSKAIPDSDVADSWIAGNMKIPKKLRLGDNPLFKAYNTAK